MRNISLVVSIILGMLMAIGKQTGLAQENQSPATAADFTLTDLTGKTHRLSQYRGKIVVLEWTNPNCPFVQRHYKTGHMPMLQKRFTEQGVIWLTINSTHPEHPDFEAAAALKKIYADWKAHFTALLLDPTGEVGRLYGARTTPHMFVIDPEGRLVYQGAIDDDPRGNRKEVHNYVVPVLEALLRGEQVEPRQTRPYGCSVKYGK